MNMHPRKWTPLAAALALMFLSALSGCSLAPVYQRPALPVPDTWPEAIPAMDDSLFAGRANLPWEDFFQDPQLRRVIQLALDNNRDLRVAVLNIQKASALYGISTAERLPNLVGDASGGRQRIPGDLSPNGQEKVSNLYGAGLGLTAFELDFFGRVRSLSESALERYMATEEAGRSAQIILLAKVASTYEAVIAGKRLEDLGRRTLDSRRDSYARQGQLKEQGASSEYDLRQSQTLLEAATATLAQQTRQRLQDENALALLVGVRLDESLFPRLDPSAARTVVGDVPAGLPSDLLEARPDIRQREALLRAMNANIGAARAAFFPRIVLTGSLGTSSTELSGLFSSGSQAWGFMPHLSLPIFDGGRNRANLDAAEADRDIAVAEYEKSIQNAFREVADALAGRVTLSQELDAVQAREQAERVRLDLSKQRYELGYSSYLEYLDAQRDLFQVQQQLVFTGLAQLQNRIFLYKALGGGWQGKSSQPA
jgi:multidrug efflux system outer membrane protein